MHKSVLKHLALEVRMRLFRLRFDDKEFLKPAKLKAIINTKDVPQTNAKESSIGQQLCSNEQIKWQEDWTFNNSHYTMIVPRKQHKKSPSLKRWNVKELVTSYHEQDLF